MKSEMHRRRLPGGAGLGGATGLQSWRVPGDPPGFLSVPLSSPLIKASVQGWLPNLKIGSAGEQRRMLSRGRAESRFAQRFEGGPWESHCPGVPGGRDGGGSTRVLKWMTVGGCSPGPPFPRAWVAKV